MTVQLESTPGITDHDLASALRKRGWGGRYLTNPLSGTTTFYDSMGGVIANVVYDNKRCLKKAVFLCPANKILTNKLNYATIFLA